MIYVKTVYGSKNFRTSHITILNNDKSADIFIEMCFEWGIDIIDIVSCEKISKTEADEVFAIMKDNK